MKKANKILMAIVAILLSLVLLSTSMVSGIFAKFVIQHSAKNTITLGRFGVDVSIIPNTTAFENAGANVELIKDEANNILSATVTGLKMRPGMDFSDALKVRFEGETNVDAFVIITFHFEYMLGDFKIPNGVANVTATSGINMMPIGLRFGALMDSTPVISNAYAGSTTPYRTQTADDAEDGYVNHIRKNIYCSFYYNVDEDTDTYISKNFDAGDKILFHPYSDWNSKTVNENVNINEFEFGFDWPDEYSDNKGYNYDEAGTYLSQNTTALSQTISFTYTVKIQQGKLS